MSQLKFDDRVFFAQPLIRREQLRFLRTFSRGDALSKKFPKAIKSACLSAVVRHCQYVNWQGDNARVETEFGTSNVDKELRQALILLHCPPISAIGRQRSTRSYSTTLAVAEGGTNFASVNSILIVPERLCHNLSPC